MNKIEKLWDEHSILIGYFIEGKNDTQEIMIVNDEEEINYNELALGYSDEDEIKPFVAKYKGKVKPLILNECFDHIVFEEDLNFVYEGDNGLYNYNSWTDKYSIALFCDEHNIYYKFDELCVALIENAGYNLEDVYRWLNEVDIYEKQQGTKEL